MTLDSVVLLLEYREIENDNCDVCEHFEHCCHFQSVCEYSPETNANRVISIDLHGVAPKPYTLEAFLSQLILWSVTIVCFCPVVAGLRQDSRIAGHYVVMAQSLGHFYWNGFLRCPSAPEQRFAEQSP